MIMFFDTRGLCVLFAITIWSINVGLATELGDEPKDISFSVDPVWRSDDREKRMTYGLNVAAPWPGGGTLFINFPEHLEYNPQGNTILRHWDNRRNLWIMSPDLKQVSYRVESLAMKGVTVEAFARVATRTECPAGARGIYLAMRIANNSRITLPVIRPLICFQYKKLTGFPQYMENFQHSFIVMNGELTALSDLPTKNLDTKFKGCVVRGCPQRDTRAERQGGLIREDMDLALSVVTELKGPRKVIFWWTPGKSMIANANIPCMHADPYFGSLKPGEKASAEGLVLFTEDKTDPIVEELIRRDRKSPRWQH